MKIDVLVLHPQADVFVSTLGREYPAVTFRGAHNPQEALGVCGESNVIVAMAHAIPATVVAKMPHLNWIQALTTGTDHLLTLNLSKDIVVTSGRGIHGPQMSEMAFLYMLSHFRDIRRLLHNQSQAKWQNWPQRLLWGKTVTILGVGAISEQLALRCKAFDMRVVGVSSSRTNVANFDKIVSRERIGEAAAEADVFVVLIPYSPETHHIVDSKVLAAMKPSALLINIARGKCIDEAAVTEALAQRKIAGAGLDVFEVEPLPVESPLRQFPQVILGSHNASNTVEAGHRTSELAIDNLIRGLDEVRR